MFSFSFNVPQTVFSLPRTVLGGLNIDFHYKCREDVGYDIGAASLDWEKKSSSSGQGVEWIEENEIRKCLMLLGTWKYDLKSSVGGKGAGSGLGNGKCWGDQETKEPWVMVRAPENTGPPWQKVKERILTSETLGTALDQRKLYRYQHRLSEPMTQRER